MGTKIIPAILCGGAGTRLWPLSTPQRPKQFHTLGGAETLFEATVARLEDALPGTETASPLILCGAPHAPLARETLHGRAATFIIEPVARNTAAIAAVAAAVATEQDPDGIVLLQPADHRIADLPAFGAAITQGASVARERIVTLGITPTWPATSYGYIKRADANEVVSDIAGFKEKPDEATARAYLASGEYLWNAGIFLSHPQVLLDEFDSSADIRDAALQALALGTRRGDEIWLDEAAFASAPSAPLDIAVMEKTRRGAVVACDIGWADLGSWSEVWRLAPRTPDGFALLGEAANTDLAKIKASGVDAVAVEGDDLVVVAAPRGIIIAPRRLTRNSDALGELAARL